MHYNSFEQWQQDLWNADHNAVRAALAAYTQYQSNNKMQLSLALPAMMHPDESIRQSAQQLLMLLMAPANYQHVEQGFEIFNSILQFYPWMGDYHTLQRQNFERFLSVRTPYLAMIANAPFYADIYLDLGRKMYMLFGLEDEALMCFEDILTYNNNHAEAYYAEGRIFEKRSHYSRALVHYERCVALQPQHIYGLLQLGWIKSNIFNKHNEAIYHYNKVVEVDPYMLEVNIRLAEAYYALGEIDRCKQFVDIALSINEFHPEALNLLATVQWKNENDYEKAQETLQKGLDHQLHGDSGLLLASLAEMQVEYFQEYPKGRTFYEKSLAAQPNQPDTVRKFVRLLITHFQAPDAAREVYEAFLQHQPRHAAIRLEYAQMLIQYFQDFELAAEHLRLSLQWDETSTTAQQLLEQVQSSLAAQHLQTKDHLVDGQDLDNNDDDDDDDDDFVEGDAIGDN